MADDPYASFSAPAQSASATPTAPAAQSGGASPTAPADPYAGIAAPVSGGKSSSGPAGGSALPSIVGVPDPSIFQRIGGEIRNALSPILGESEDQKRTREASLSMLGNISPTLANYVQDAAPKPTTGLAGKAVDMVMQGGGAVGGQELGAVVGGPFDEVTIPLGGAIGGAAGDYAAQKRRVAAGEQDSVHPGEVVGAALSGAIPGGSLEKTGAGAIAYQAIKQGVGGLASATAQSAIDEKQLPGMRDAAWAAILPALTGSIAEGVQQASPEISAARNTATAAAATKSGIKDAFQAEGGVVNPAKVNPGTINKTLVGIAGSPQVNQAASGINGEVASNIARAVLDPSNPAGVELSEKVAQATRQRAYDVGYRPLANIGNIPADAQYQQDLQNILSSRTGSLLGPDQEIQSLVTKLNQPNMQSAGALKDIQILRNNSGQSFRQGENDMAIAQRQGAGAIENLIERHLQTNGNFNAPDLLQDFRDSRTLMAQSHDIEDAVQEGANAINPRSLAAAYQAAPQKLSGGVKTIGAFANVFPDVTKNTAGMNTPGTTATGRWIPALAGALGGTTLAASGHTGAGTLAGIAGLLAPSVRDAVRTLVLSGPYQRIMTKIPVNVAANPDLGALVIRQGGQAAALQGRSPQGDGSGQ